MAKDLHRAGHSGDRHQAADGTIVGQATVLIFPHLAAARMLMRYDIRQLTEATALSLMRDMSATAQ